MPKPKPVCPKQGELIQGRYKVLKTLGEGGFGAVFEVVDENLENHYAMKFELEKQPDDEPGLDLEGAVLKRLQGYAQVLKYIDEGEWSEQKMTYLIMELAGSSLANLRYKLKDHRFSNNTLTRIAAQCITAIETVHLAGLLHRGIKPGNFAMGHSEKDKRTVFILDFGLVRKHILSNGKVRPQRSSAAFRGSIQYASINAHKNIDLGRMDDLWCWLYMVVQLRVGKLPWRHLSGKNEVGRMKSKTTKKALLLDMDDEYHEIYENLTTLEYADKPPYVKYYDLLMKIMERRKFAFNDPFDWEEEKEEVSSEKEEIKETNTAISKLSHVKPTETQPKAAAKTDQIQKPEDAKTKTSLIVQTKIIVPKENADEIDIKVKVPKTKEKPKEKFVVEILNDDVNEEFALTESGESKAKVVQVSSEESKAKIVQKFTEESKAKDEVEEKDVKQATDLKPKVVQESKTNIIKKPSEETKISEITPKVVPKAIDESKVVKKPIVESKAKEEQKIVKETKVNRSKVVQKPTEEAKPKIVKKIVHETKSKDVIESADAGAKVVQKATGKAKLTDVPKVVPESKTKDIRKSGQVMKSKTVQKTNITTTKEELRIKKQPNAKKVKSPPTPNSKVKDIKKITRNSEQNAVKNSIPISTTKAAQKIVRQSKTLNRKKVPPPKKAKTKNLHQKAKAKTKSQIIRNKFIHIKIIF